MVDEDTWVKLSNTPALTFSSPEEVQRKLKLLILKVIVTKNPNPT